MTGSTTRPLAVVTGASSGIGRELAKQFALHDFDVLISAEDDELDDARREIDSYGVTVDAVRADLAKQEGVEELAERVITTDRPVAALAINAGVGANGAFVDVDLQDHLNIVDLNIRSSIHLARRLVPGMVQRHSGRVLFTSSIAGTMPGPFSSVYNASKSFLTSFSQALREELKGSGVTVTALLPGPTDTEFFERANMTDTKLGAGPKDDPADVARQGYDALMAGKDQIIAGSRRNKAQVGAARIAPAPVMAAVHRRMTEPGSAKR
ncbi:SDR family NAD(P)-dependent oxidoreductase [Qaidamihabitans albus]|uniref:SDR family NAD(P)-dependent oxidoreductase n=1 Tax=Qaidamihabitans albus TaxID=2795733 RepID=UPI0018F1E498|nr:SDR family NAD(P)-dependent oxidoreductase [Qaidamihabitans albus]